MGGNRNNSYLAFSGAVAPEDTVCAGGVLLCVSFEDFLALFKGVGHGLEFVGLQAGVSRICCQLPNTLGDLLEESLRF